MSDVVIYFFRVKAQVEMFGLQLICVSYYYSCKFWRLLLQSRRCRATKLPLFCTFCVGCNQIKSITAGFLDVCTRYVSFIVSVIWPLNVLFVCKTTFYPSGMSFLESCLMYYLIVCCDTVKVSGTLRSGTPHCIPLQSVALQWKVLRRTMQMKESLWNEESQVNVLEKTLNDLLIKLNFRLAL